MVRHGKVLLICLAALAGAGSLRADEAIGPTGKQFAGRLLPGRSGWVFRTDRGKEISATELAHVRFCAKPIPLPKAQLVHTLHLANGQRITGSHLKVDEKKIVFTASWGKTLTLDRAEVLGVEQANDSVPILADDFAAGLKAWQVEGKPVLDPQRILFGKASVRIAGTFARTWQPALHDGAIRLFFFDSGDDAERQWAVEIIVEKKDLLPPRFEMDWQGYTCRNVKQAFAPAEAMPGWHMVAIEIAAGRLRLFVDDACLGETALPAAEAIKGIRIVHGKGSFWIAALSVTRKLEPMGLPTPAGQDSIWLEKGEQIFGRISAADGEMVSLQGKFGKRSLPWSRLRGILFAQTKKTPPAQEPEIIFRPGPGFSLDSLRAKLVRWEDEKLIVDHAVLGEVAIERDRLHMVRFAAK